MKKVLGAQQQAASLSVSSVWNQTNGDEPLDSRCGHFTAVATSRFRQRGSARSRNKIKTPCTRRERRGVTWTHCCGWDECEVMEKKRKNATCGDEIDGSQSCAAPTFSPFESACLAVLPRDDFKFQQSTSIRPLSPASEYLKGLSPFAGPLPVTSVTSVIKHEAVPKCRYYVSGGDCAACKHLISGEKMKLHRIFFLF